MTRSRTSENPIDEFERLLNEDERSDWLAKAGAINALLLGHLLLGWAMVANILIEQPPNLGGVVAALVGYAGAWGHGLLPERMTSARAGAAIACILGTSTSWLCFLVSLYLGA